MTEEFDEHSRPYPVPDQLSAPMWEAARDGTLVVQRCGECRRYHYPPRPYCTDCGSVTVNFEPVSGNGVVEDYTENRSGARHPYFHAQLPYLVGTVELQEQRGLLMYSNFPGSRLEDLSAGAPVSVEFEDIGDGHVIPQFRLVSQRSSD